jgi:hypothetical protein
MTTRPHGPEPETQYPFPAEPLAGALLGTLIGAIAVILAGTPVTSLGVGAVVFGLMGFARSVNQRA